MAKHTNKARALQGTADLASSISTGGGQNTAQAETTASNQPRIDEINSRIKELLGDKKGGLTGDPLTSLLQSSTPESRERDKLLEELKGLGGSDPNASAGDKAIAAVEGIQSPEDSNIRPAGEDLVQAEVDKAGGELKDEQARRDEAETQKDTITTDKEGLVKDIEGERDNLTGSLEEVKAGIEQAKEDIKEIPGEVKTEFERLRSQFENTSNIALDRVDSQREAALADVFMGQGAAMEAAVQGIQGNLNSTIAKIQANPNLTSAQKASMIMQTKLAGASALAPAVGATIVQFAEIRANIATTFGTISGNVQSTILGQQGNLAVAAGNAFSLAQVEVGKMTTQLLEVQANVEVAFSAAQNQLLGTRAMVENNANQQLLNLLPELGEPYLDLTNAAATRLTFENDMWLKNANLVLNQAGFQLQVAMIQSMQGTPGGNMLMGLAGGYSQGGIPGAIAGGVGGYVGSLGPGI